jgi:hypothetical protein
MYSFSEGEEMGSELIFFMAIAGVGPAAERKSDRRQLNLL